MSAPAISVQDVWKYFGDFPAVRGVSFEIPSGTTLALLGRNGAGKTTLLHMIAGLSRPSRGRISIAGNHGTSQPDSIGMVGHGQWLYEDLTARENLSFFARLYRVEDAGRKIEHWLEVTELSRFQTAQVSQFSRGMRQRLAVARAFLHDPQVLLLDEPWTALDDRAVNLLSSLLGEAQSRQRTVVICSHQLREALLLATDVAVLDRGRLAFLGKNTAELKASPDELYQRIS